MPAALDLLGDCCASTEVAACLSWSACLPLAACIPELSAEACCLAAAAALEVDVLCADLGSVANDDAGLSAFLSPGPGFPVSRTLQKLFRKDELNVNRRDVLQRSSLLLCSRQCSQ